jgi:hypothetical protein
VHKPDGYGEVDVPEPDRSRVIEATFRALEQTKAEAVRAEADAPYCEAQICIQGDVQSSDGTPFNPAGHCTKCGAPCINVCLNCKAPIRGKEKYSAAIYECSSFCHRCGHPYPWMDDKLRTAHDLLFHDDQLTYEGRKELWGSLRYVMSSPEAELAPAKSKLIAIKIQKAAAPIKDFVTDLLAKYAAEMSSLWPRGTKSSGEQTVQTTATVKREQAATAGRQSQCYSNSILNRARHAGDPLAAHT